MRSVEFKNGGMILKDPSPKLGLCWYCYASLGFSLGPGNQSVLKCGGYKESGNEYAASVTMNGKPLSKEMLYELLQEKVYFNCASVLD